MESRKRLARAYYGSQAPPDEEFLATAEALDQHPAVLYEKVEGQATGLEPDLVKGLYVKMDTLKRSPTTFRTWTEEDGTEAFLGSLLDLTPSDMRSRVQLLQLLGSFKFRNSATFEDKKSLIEGVFAVDEKEDVRHVLRRQARRLSLIWSPKPETLLSYVIGHPALAGRALADRLSPTNTQPLRLIAHFYEDVRSNKLKPIVEARSVAYERAGEIHFVAGVRRVLEMWDEDAGGAGCAQITLFEALLLHELVELYLDEAQPELEPLPAHVIATTFERYLKGRMLSVAVEDFFLSWPPLSASELAEIRKAEQDQLLADARAYFQEEVAVLDEADEKADGLPVEPSGTTPVRKKKVAAKRKNP
ncbi:MAG: hypothetical protein FJY95_09075 [Candidatus Handelsmanbacteria bacterium]|nr:hypothetical protein [Candidatus Handelsmanbacteria bacterium]